MTNFILPSRTCYPCPFSHYRNSSISSQRCVRCPETKGTNFKGATSIDDCVCDLGFYFSVTEARCIPCAIGFYKDVAGNEACTPCPANTSTLITGDYPCRCKPGYTGPDNGVCSACLLGYYKISYGSSSCDACPPGSSTLNQGSTNECGDCTLGRRPKYPASSCPCELCPAGTYGTYQVGPDPYACELCEFGKYSSSPGSIECSQCPENSITSSQGASRVQDCECKQGYYFDVSRSLCKECPPATYKDFIGNQACLPCPGTKMSSIPGSTQADHLAQCECPPGYYGSNGGECTPCPVDTYKEDFGSLQCQDCP
ncbi:hypothetical protein GUITHDRAFT_76631, partial [Guillardia theta CCMP2712]